MNAIRLTELLDTYYTVTGMETAVLNADLHTVASARYAEENFCSYIHNSEYALNTCKRSDVEQLVAVSRTRTARAYTCPFGITEAIVPIIRDEMIVGYLISTIGISNEEGNTAPRLAPTLKGLDTQRLAELSLAVAKVSEKQIRAHLNMLSILAEHIAHDTALSFGEESIGTLTKHYIKQNLDKKITLADIALHLHSSTVTVTEHFRREFGETVVSYITKKRMELAKKLLLSTDRTLSSIAQSVGYPDVEYFSRSFKKHFGKPPAAWRKDNTPTK